MNKKRKHQRHQINHQIKFKLPPVSTMPFEISVAENISSGGICVHAFQCLPVAKLLKLYFNLPYFDTLVSCVAKVAWAKSVKSSHPYKMGMEFIKIDENVRKELIDHLHYRPR